MKTFLLFLVFFLLAMQICFAQWNQMAEMPTARLGHSMCVLNGKIYAIGGANTQEEPAFPTVEVYDPILNTWETKADLLTARANFATCILDGKILVIGGGQSFFWDPLASIEEYDPVTDTWTHKTNMPRARMGLTASLVNGKIYVIGGADSSEISFVEVDVWDPVTDTWITVTDLPTPRFNLPAVALNGEIYTIGGHIGFPWDGLTIVEKYNPVTDAWTTIADLTIGRKYFTASAMNGKIFVFGGSKGHVTNNRLSSVEEYDPTFDSWTEITDMPNVLVGASAVPFNGKIYVSGGNETEPTPNGTFLVVNTMYEFNLLAAYGRSLEIKPLHISPLGDTLFVNASLSNPEDHPVTVYTTFSAAGQTYQDSMQLFDDGLHGDGGASDNIFGGKKWLSGLEEDFYIAELYTSDLTAGTTHLFPPKSHFTTAGPLTLDSIAYSALTNFRYSVKPFIKHEGNTLPISDVQVKLLSDDPWVTQVFPDFRTCPNILPSEIKSVTQPFAVYYDSATFPGYFNLKFEILSNEVPYWTDSSSITVVTEIIDDLTVAKTFKLDQNYPNPFNPTTRIKYSVPKLSFVTIKIYDVLGSEVAALVNEEKTAGTYELNWDAENFPSGVYFYRIQAGSFIDTKKMILIK